MTDRLDDGWIFNEIHEKSILYIISMRCLNEFETLLVPIASYRQIQHWAYPPLRSPEKLEIFSYIQSVDAIPTHFVNSIPSCREVG